MKEYYHVWNSIFVGLPRPLRRLKMFHPDLKEAWDKLEVGDLVKIGIKPEHFARFKYQKKTGDAFKESDGFKKLGIKTVTLDCNDYPEQLYNLNNHISPHILYYRGNLRCSKKVCVSIVGTRGITAYGQAVTQKIVKGLSADFIVVSGLARGVDLCGHTEALKNKLETIAILGFGLNKIPYHLSHIATQIEENGALISEYPPNLGAQKYHVPLRNRMISGLSKAVIVVEAGKPSGALITARYALDQSREVFAVPGDITKDKSKGTNELLMKGAAHPLCDLNEFFEILKIDKSKNKKELHFDGDKKLVIEELNKIPLSKIEILNKLPIVTAKLTSTLTELEMAEAIQKHKNGKYYVT